MIIWAVLSRGIPILEGNKYTVIDPLNITSVAPIGNCFIIPTKDE